MMQCLECHQVRGPGISSGGLLSTRRNEAVQRRTVISEDHIDHVEACDGGGSVEADQIPRDKLRSAIKSASSCFGQAGEGIVFSHCGRCTSLHTARDADGVSSW